MSKMKQTERLHFIIETLREGSQTIHELKQLIEERSAPISVRQIQRDLNEIDKFLPREEKLISYRRNYLKYYKIEKNTDYNSIHKMDDAIIETNFYEQKLSKVDTEKLEIIKNAIEGSKSIIVSNLINDETGDNYNFTTTNISFIPLKIIYHRNSLYVGGYNNNKNIVQIFGINQLQNITLSKAYKNKTTSAPLNTFLPGNIYTVDDIVVSENNIVTDPTQSLINVTVNVTVKAWESTALNPDFGY